MYFRINFCIKFIPFHTKSCDTIHWKSLIGLEPSPSFVLSLPFTYSLKFVRKKRDRENFDTLILREKILVNFNTFDMWWWCFMTFVSFSPTTPFVFSISHSFSSYFSSSSPLSLLLLFLFFSLFLFLDFFFTRDLMFFFFQIYTFFGCVFISWQFKSWNFFPFFLFLLFSLSFLFLSISYQ